MELSEKGPVVGGEFGKKHRGENIKDFYRSW